MAIDDFDAIILFLQRSKVRIMFPNRGKGRPHIGHEFARVFAMEIPHRGG